ncbi:hypothetical protein [Desulfothermobacter acidiphilus]|uniref:hypothetical protein n=1 Tax=Desulfothermobacter acidiphilus TaxID=1938353 RepID=UPI003F8C647A
MAGKQQEKLLQLLQDLTVAVNRQVEALKDNSPGDLMAATEEAEEILRFLFQVGLDKPAPTPELKQAVGGLREAREKLRLLLAQAVALDLEAARCWQRMGARALDCSV